MQQKLSIAKEKFKLTVYGYIALILFLRKDILKQN